MDRNVQISTATFSVRAPELESGKKKKTVADRGSLRDQSVRRRRACVPCNIHVVTRVRDDSFGSECSIAGGEIARTPLEKEKKKLKKKRELCRLEPVVFKQLFFHADVFRSSKNCPSQSRHARIRKREYICLQVLIIILLDKYVSTIERLFFRYNYNMVYRYVLWPGTIPKRKPYFLRYSEKH